MNKVNKILKERGSRYGKFKDFAEISQKLKDIMFLNLNLNSEQEYEEINNVILEGIEMICHKLARIANGDPYYSDNFNDIAGYASLVGSELEKLKEEQKENEEAFNEFIEINNKLNKKQNKKPKGWKDKCLDCVYCERTYAPQYDIDFYTCKNANNTLDTGYVINGKKVLKYQEPKDIWEKCKYKESVLK